jgi:hypothetical protein
MKIMIFVGFVIANVSWGLIFKEDLRNAFDHSFWQGSALFALYVVELWDK